MFNLLKYILLPLLLFVFTPLYAQNAFLTSCKGVNALVNIDKQTIEKKSNDEHEHSSKTIYSFDFIVNYKSLSYVECSFQPKANETVCNITATMTEADNNLHYLLELDKKTKNFTFKIAGLSEKAIYPMTITCISTN